MDDGISPGAPSAGDPIPSEIDGFSIQALLGRGSGGAVYLARQQRPERLVALKVLGSSALDFRGLERFEREVELLAGIEHPNIPRLYGTGSWKTASGSHPYLVMEPIEGQSLTDHCATAGLPLAGRMRLLAQIARAVHYVHARGVVHRDLKPQNIQVTPHGVPMVLDFGVAKWRNRVQDSATLTRDGEVVGTLPYMAPEQIEGLNEAIDLRCDVYALGTIAFELIAGALPYPQPAFRTVITALETLRHDPPEQQPARLAAPADLRTIVAKAVAARSVDRYQSALELALDLERYLASEPIQARPPSIRHMLALFVRRHRAISIAAAIAVGSLTAGLAAAVHFGLRERQALARAAARAEELASTNRFLSDMLQGADPLRTGGERVSMSTALDQARDQLLKGSALKPAVDIRIRSLLGGTYVSLGALDVGLPLVESAHKRAAEDPSIDPLLREQATVALATALSISAQPARTAPLLAPFLAIPPGTDEERRRLWVEEREVLLEAALGGADIAAAQHYSDELGDLPERWFGPMDGQTLTTRASRATLLDNLDRHEDALREGMTLAEQIGTQLSRRHPIRLALLMTAGAQAYHLGRLPLAHQLLSEGAALNLEVYGPDALFTLDSQQRLAQVEHRMNPAATGPVVELKRIMEAETRLLGEADKYTTGSVNFYARALLESRDPKLQAQGEALMERVVDGVERGSRPVNRSTLRLEAGLAQRMLDTGRKDRGIALYREVLAMAETTVGAQSDVATQARATLEKLAAGPGALR